MVKQFLTQDKYLALYCDLKLPKGPLLEIINYL